MNAEKTFYNFSYEAKLVDCFRNRIKLLQACESDLVLREIVKKKCKDDPKFFFEMFLFTVKNRTFFSENMPDNIPFKLFEYQEEMVDTVWWSINHKRDIFIEKSRQMSATWVVLGVYLYGFIFYRHSYLIISRTGSEVDNGSLDSCFGRLRYMLSLIPEWLLPEGFDKKKGSETNKHMLISRPEGIGLIRGQAAGPDAGRSGTYQSVFMDEMAFMRDGESINNAVGSATPCKIMNSTPHGERNEYYKMRTMTMAMSKIPKDERKIIGLRLIWNMHPYYTQDWYDWYTASKTPSQVEQELNINYNVSLQGRVYPEFDQAPIGRVEFGEYQYDYSLPLYCSIDNSHGGSDPNAVIIAQQDRYGKIIIIDCLQTGIAPTHLAEMLAGRPTIKLGEKEMDFYERFKQYKTPLFIADPNDTNSSMDITSIRKIYKKVGIELLTPHLISDKGKRVKAQIDLVRLNLDRIRVNIPQCDEFISAIQNATYPQRSDDSQATTDNTVPVHNWTSHYRTSLEYLVMMITEWESKSKEKQKIIKEIPNYITGQNRRVELTI